MAFEPLKIDQEDLLQDQEEELLSLNIAPVEGSTVEDVGRGVGEVGGVQPAGVSDTASFKKIKEETRLAQAELAALEQTGDTASSKYKAAKAKIRTGTILQDRALKPSPDIPDRSPEKLYATGSSYGFAAVHDAQGKIKDVYFLNGPGVTKTPTLSDAFRMITEPVNSKASAALKDSAAQSLEAFQADMDKSGISPDAQSYFGEQARTALSQRMHEEVGIDPARDPMLLEVQHNSSVKVLMNEVFGDDFKPEDMTVVEARTITDADKAVLDSMQETLRTEYDAIKNDAEATRDVGGARNHVMGTVIEEYKEQLQAMGKSGAQRTLLGLHQAFDAVRGQNFQFEIQKAETEKAEEMRAFTNTALNSVIEEVRTGGPINFVQQVGKHQFNFLDMPGGANLVNEVVGSEIVGTFLNDSVTALHEQAKSEALKIRELDQPRQLEFTARGLVSMIGQRTSEAPPEQRQSLLENVHNMNVALGKGGVSQLVKEFPELQEPLGVLHKQATLGMNQMQRQKELKDLKLEEDKLEALTEVSRRFNQLQYPALDDKGRIIWKLAKDESDFAEQIEDLLDARGDKAGVLPKISKDFHGIDFAGKLRNLGDDLKARDIQNKVQEWKTAASRSNLYQQTQLAPATGSVDPRFSRGSSLPPGFGSEQPTQVPVAQDTPNTEEVLSRYGLLLVGADPNDRATQLELKQLEASLTQAGITPEQRTNFVNQITADAP